MRALQGDGLRGSPQAFCAIRVALRQARQAVKGTRSDTAAVPATVGGEVRRSIRAQSRHHWASSDNWEGVDMDRRSASQETWPPPSLVRCPGPDRGVGPAPC